MIKFSGTFVNANEWQTHALTLLIGLTQLYIWGTTYYLPAALLPIVPGEIQTSSWWMTGGISWALLLGGLVAPRLGKLIEAEGGRRVLTWGSLLSGVGLLLLLQIHGVLGWYIAWTILGLGMAMGLFNAAFATLLWPLTNYLMQTCGWRIMLMMYAVPHLLIAAPLFHFMIPASVPEHDTESTSMHEVKPKKIKLMFILLAIYIILRSMIGTTVSIDILVLFKSLGLTAAISAASAALIGPAQIVGRILEMFVGRNFSAFHTAIFWTAMLPVAIAILLVIGPSATSVFSVIYGMSNGVLTITMGVLPMILFGVRGYASILGKLAVPTLIAQALTPLLVNPLIQQASAGVIFLLAGALGCIALLCMMGLSRLGSS